MQKIERYGVIALVVLLVTILAVSLWGESKDGWQFWKKDTKKSEAASTDRLGRRNLPGAQPSGGPTAPLDKNGLPLSQPLQTPLATPANSPAPAQNPALVRNETTLGSAPINSASNGSQSSPMPTPVGLQGAPGTANAQHPASDPASLALNTPAKPADALAQPVVRGLDNKPKDANAAPGGATRAYTVKDGDTLGEIASHELGSSARWTEIQKLNGNLDPKKLRAGMTLQLPAGKSVAATTPAKSDDKSALKTPAKAASGRAYVVKEGDSLSKIASRELGDGDRWTEIRDLNPQIDPKGLKVGASLTLPGAARADTTSVAKAGSDEVIGWGPRTSGKKSRVQ